MILVFLTSLLLAGAEQSVLIQKSEKIVDKNKDEKVQEQKQ